MESDNSVAAAGNDTYLAIKEQLLGTRDEPHRAASDLLRPPLSKADKRNLPFATRQRLERPMSSPHVPAAITQNTLARRPLPKSLYPRTVLCFLILGALLIWPTFVYAFYYIVKLFFLADSRAVIN